MIRAIAILLVFVCPVVAQENSEGIGRIRKLLDAKDVSQGDPILAISLGQSPLDQQADAAAAIKAEADGTWSLHVFRRGFVSFKEVWSQRQTEKVDLWCPTPLLYLTKSELVAATFQRSTSTLVCDRWTRKRYSRKKNQFALMETKEEAALCELGCYDRLAAQALAEGVPQEQVLAIVLVVPSFWRESAYILGRDSNGPFVIRREFTRQLWSELGVMRSRKTADEGLVLARSIPITTSRLTTSPETVQALITGLNLITPRKLDACPDCALMVDGRSFHLWLGKEPPFKVTDISEPKSRSENPQALRWVYEVMAAAGDE